MTKPKQHMEMTNRTDDLLKQIELENDPEYQRMMAIQKMYADPEFRKQQEKHRQELSEISKRFHEKATELNRLISIYDEIRNIRWLIVLVLGVVAFNGIMDFIIKWIK
jgi:hypothetical protein